MLFVIKKGYSVFNIEIDRNNYVKRLYEMSNSNQLYFRDEYMHPDKLIIEYFEVIPKVYLYDRYDEFYWVIPFFYINLYLSIIFLIGYI